MKVTISMLLLFAINSVHFIVNQKLLAFLDDNKLISCAQMLRLLLGTIVHFDWTDIRIRMDTSFFVIFVVLTTFIVLSLNLKPLANFFGVDIA